MPDLILENAALLAAGAKLGDAISLLEQAVQDGQETAAIAKLLAKLSLQINEVRAFQSWCHEALRMDPNDIEVYKMLEAYFRSNGRDWEADEVRDIAASIKL